MALRRYPLVLAEGIRVVLRNFVVRGQVQLLQTNFLLALEGVRNLKEKRNPRWRWHL